MIQKRIDLDFGLGQTIMRAQKKEVNDIIDKKINKIKDKVERDVNIRIQNTELDEIFDRVKNKMEELPTPDLKSRDYNPYAPKKVKKTKIRLT